MRVDILEQFWYTVQSNLYSKITSADIDKQLTIDDSQFVVVDGEEGDYGIYKYFHNTELVAKRTIYGGDVEDTEFTEYGKTFLKIQFYKLLDEVLDNV